MGEEGRIIMKKNFTAENGIIVAVHTIYDFVELVDASEYGDDTGLRILWWNPKVCNGESQIDAEIFPMTVEGILRAEKEAKKLNENIWYENSYHA